MTTHGCIYCHKEVLPNQAYSFRKMGGNTIYWHYLCYARNAREMLEFSTSAKNELLKYLLKSFPSPDGWVLDVLRSLGYGKE